MPSARTVQGLKLSSTWMISPRSAPASSTNTNADKRSFRDNVVAKFGVEPGELKEMLTNAKGEIAVATLKRAKDTRGQFELRPSNFRVYPDTPPLES
jgi:hypothetical protein